MSESRKRSRKSKLEVRQECDDDDTETTILQQETQKIPRLFQQRPKILDHTYSIQHALPAPIQLSVKVEVEEFDEDSIRDDFDDDSQVPTKDLSVPTKTKKNPASIHYFHINLDKMLKISDHISWSSTNPADKYLGIEIKNVWGRIYELEEKEDPYNLLIQAALKLWHAEYLHCNARLNRETPLLYQCHICNLAWWHLYPFTEHIRNHNAETLRVYHQENIYDSFIIANTEVDVFVKLIDVPGHCHQCGQDYKFHNLQAQRLYTCNQCHRSFQTCFKYLDHYKICPLREQKTLMYKCEICSSVFAEAEESESHMIMCHSVRSDLPTIFYSRTCNVCQRFYHHFSTHICIKSSMNSKCSYCYRRFSTKALCESHMMSKEIFKCKICDGILEKQCMGTEHILFHTDQYKMAYKCVNTQCSPFDLFPDEKSARLHKTMWHRQKLDKRRAYYEMVLVPTQCIKTEKIQVASLQKEPSTVDTADKVAKTDRSITKKYFDTDTVTNKVTQAEMEMDKDIQEDLIVIKQEIAEFPEMQQDDDSHEMEYESMLSNVFKVSSEFQRAPQNVTSFTENFVSLTQNDASLTQNAASLTQNDAFLTQNDASPTEDNKSLDFVNVAVKTEPVDYDDSLVIEEHPLFMDIKGEPSDYIVEEQECEIKTEVPDEIDISPNLDVKLETIECKAELVEDDEINVVDNSTEQRSSTSILQRIKKEMNKEISEQEPERKRGRPKQEQVEVTTASNIFRGKHRIYRCTRCGYTNRHKLYRLHMDSNCAISQETQLWSNQFKCTKCDKLFYTLKAYMLHFENHGYCGLTCPSCELKFDSMLKLLRHVRKHVRHNFVSVWMISDQNNVSTNRQRRCQICQECIPSSDFFPHWESHLELKDPNSRDRTPVQPVDSEPMERVTVSNSKSLPPLVLARVLQQLKSVGHERECEVCVRYFERRYDCKRHLIEHLLSDAYTRKLAGEKPFLRCQMCAKGFTTANYYKFHMREHGAMPVYKCALCDKTFSDSSNFAKHKKVHSLKVLICDICGKKFHAKVSIEKHMLCHMSSDPMQCSRCEKIFFDKSHYRRHFHNKHKVHKYRCILCDELFASLRAKWDHAWLVHKERKLEADCPVCWKSFRKYNDVKTHCKKEHNVTVSIYKNKIKIKRARLPGPTFYRISEPRGEETLIVTEPDVE